MARKSDQTTAFFHRLSPPQGKTRGVSLASSGEKDLLNAVLHYMALLAVIEYLASKEEPEFDINKVIQEKIIRSISEGQ